MCAALVSRKQNAVLETAFSNNLKNMKMNSLKSILAATLLVGCANSAFALTYDATQGLAPLGGATHSSNGTLVTATKKGITFLGVEGGNAGPEIDVGQYITIDFGNPNGVVFDYISFGLLYDGPEFGDFLEIAAAAADGTLYTLTALTSSTGEWLMGGAAVAGSSVVNVSPATQYNAALWKVMNPFPGITVKSLKIYPINNPDAPQGSNPADFGLVGYKVPDASSTLFLLGSGLFVLGAFSRYSRKA